MKDVRFDFEWSQATDADPRRSNTASELIISIDSIPVTKLFDSWSKTVTDRARLPLYPLAEWFAYNWWRLHAEPPFEAGTRPPTEWRLAHDLGAIGGGFVWPRVRFAFDGEGIQASARAMKNAPWEPVRHLNDVPPVQIDLQLFDGAVDELITTVIQRLKDLGVSAEPLTTIWANVCAGRADPEVSAWRRWEASLGYDADNAPEALIEDIQLFSERAATQAALELAPLLRPNERDSINRLSELAHSPGVEALPSIYSKIGLPTGTPWDVGRQLARDVRSAANIDHGR